MTLSKQDNELTNEILDFHQKNYAKAGILQPITDPRASFFQYSRYYGVLTELAKISFESFLDVGCSEGMYLLAVKNKYPASTLYGVDFSAIGLKKAKDCVGPISSFACADAAHLPFRSNSFDLILCSETLEHIVDDIYAFKEIQRICRKACIITVPSFNNQWAKKRFKPDVNCERDSHLRKYSRRDLQSILQSNFRQVIIYDVASWYLASFDVVMHMFLKQQIASKFSYALSNFVDLDYRLCRAGAHGHSFLCVCKK
jgi:ubiquinone/menaquinone biosynthesis C-methylase UbiE